MSFPSASVATSADHRPPGRFLFAWSAHHPASGALFELCAYRRESSTFYLDLVALGPDIRPDCATRSPDYGSLVELEAGVVFVKTLLVDAGFSEPVFQPWLGAFEAQR